MVSNIIQFVYNNKIINLNNPDPNMLLVLSLSQYRVLSLDIACCVYVSITLIFRVCFSIM